MSGDYSRIRFDPRMDIASVWMQQGRVQLDSDWNEGMAALDRRLRAESVDTFGVQPVPGMTGVAVVSPQTPDAFKIEVAGSDMTIGRGRMYVDGLLAENHGGGAVEFDAVLAELRGQTALAYQQQPYFSAPPALPGGGPHLVYLEVWSRELTYLQRPEIVENAVGADTTTRWQTVWQVRLLGNIGSVDCTTPDGQFPAWQALTQSSGGRLSIKAEGVPPDLDPCELPPSGGYRGLENQLYRIEIHDGGAVGAATFKWSRDNASVASPVVEIVSQTAASTELKLASLGRDAVLRFNTGDWVEILDDRRELNGENGDPVLRRGVMRQITVDNARQTIQFSPALPADLIPAGGDDTLAARHTRVRRWDQQGTVRDADSNVIVNLDDVGSTGLIPVPAAGVWVVLEKGVQIRFGLDPGGSGFHSGDYWVSAARTANTSVETFTDAPPRGIHRHYARLAIVTFPDAEQDCRTHWPPACGGCCTLTVAPGESIQAALDVLPAVGGCVCLKTGIHAVSAPIEIRASNIILQGEGPGAIVRSSSPGAVLQIGVNTPVSDIVVQRIRFETTRAVDFGMLLYADNCTRLEVTHCEFAVTATALTTPVGLYLNRVADVVISRNHIRNVRYGIWLGEYDGRMAIEGNIIEGMTGDTAVGSFSLGQYGIAVNPEEAASCHIESNIIRHFWIGIHLGNYATSSTVIGNRIHRSPFSLQEPAPSDTAALRQYLDTRLYAIDVSAADCEVRRNAIDLESSMWGGIRVSAADVTIASNCLHSLFKPSQLPVPAGIYCLADIGQGRAADQVTLSDNHLLGPQTGIVISRINDAVVRGNLINGNGGGWYGVRLDDCRHGSVQDNTLQEVFFALHSTAGERNHMRGNHIDQVVTGITASQEFDAEISDNHLQSCIVVGITVFVSGSAALLNNRLMNCSYSPALSMGLAVFSEALPVAGGSLVRIDGCEVIDTGVSADGSQVTTVRALGMAGWVPALQVVNNRVGYTQADQIDPQQEHRAFLFIGPLAYRVVTGAAVVELMFGSALVSSNHFQGPGLTTLVEFLRLAINDNLDFRFEKVTFSNNICDHLHATFSQSGATVHLWGGHLVVMGNHIKGPLRVNAMALGNRNQVALMGNVTTGDYIQVGTVIPAPINNFNVRI
jgi:nitrous oxidase accessory protein NosD